MRGTSRIASERGVEYMNKVSSIIGPEDYMEPACPLCGEPFGAEPAEAPVPQERVLRKLDAYLERRDYAGAERHLLYWIEEARLARDKRGELLVRNELIGHYRKTGNRDKALENVEEALRLLKALKFEETFSAGTTYVNAATAYHAFGDPEQALVLFRKARPIYENAKHGDLACLGGLYNNMALALTELKQYEEAFSLFGKALQVMREVPDGEPEQAVTLLNMADVVAARDGMEEGEAEISRYLDQAYDLLHDYSGDRNGRYAFVCEKCAPVFGYYGYFLAEEELKTAAEEIYGQQDR